MRDWLSTSDLVDLALPGMPATQRGWNDFVEREGWVACKDKVRQRVRRGGGLEYHITLLPPEALAAYAARAIGDVALPASVATVAAAEPAATRMTLSALESRDARLALIAAADRFARNATLSRNTADRAFCALYNLERLDIEPWIRAAVKALAPRTLARWRATSKAAKSRLGVDRGAARRGKGVLEAAENGEVRKFALALIAHQPHLSADHVREIVADRFPALKMPPIRSVRRFLQGLKKTENVLLTKLTNPDAFKSRYRLSGTNSHPVSRLNELWMIDASPVDALCKDGRHSLYVCIDIFSRRIIIHVSRTPRAEAVALLMRRAILAWGVPERVKTDNGSDFRAKATQRLFAALQIETEAAAPFSPEQKGHVERAIGTLQRDLMPLLPGFIGHSVKDRKIIEERKAFSARLGEDDARAFCVDLTPDELQARCDWWADVRYAQRPHEGLKGATPFAAAAAFPGKLRRIEDVRALDLLLAPVAGKDGLRTVTKTGLKIAGATYLCAVALPGAEVFVRMDPADMGRALVFEPDGETFLGVAICPDLAGVDPVAAVMEAKAAQRALLDEGVKELRAEMRKIKPRDMVDAVARRTAERSGKLVSFPKAADTHSTPALRAAAEAIEPAQAVVAAPLAAPAAAPANVQRLPETKQQRFRRALALEADLSAGVAVSAADAHWLGGYQAGAEYLAQRAMYEDFGEAALR